MTYVDPFTHNGFQWECRLCEKVFLSYESTHVHGVWNALEAGDPTIINSPKDLPEFDEAFLTILRDLGDGSYLLGNNRGINWDQFYEMMESFYGWDMQDMDGAADSKIRRVVHKMVREGEIG